MIHYAHYVLLRNGLNGLEKKLTELRWIFLIIRRRYGWVAIVMITTYHHSSSLVWSAKSRQKTHTHTHHIHRVFAARLGVLFFYVGTIFHMTHTHIHTPSLPLTFFRTIDARVLFNAIEFLTQWINFSFKSIFMEYMNLFCILLGNRRFECRHTHKSHSSAGTVAIVVLWIKDENNA